MALVTYISAITEALQEEMRRDERVFIIGEDVGVEGGVFKATKGLYEEFGAERVIDSPLAEGVIVSAAIGAAWRVLKPVPEIQFSDFITPAMDALTQQAAKLRYRSGGTQTCPLTLRVCYGGGVGGGLYHSQTNTTWFAHEPGLIVVAPGTVADAKGMLKAAIRQDDPVIYFEHKKLYRSIKEDLAGWGRLCHGSVQGCGAPAGDGPYAGDVWLDVAALVAGGGEDSCGDGRGD
jgi:2-oxoisovalerate dehydrogenase E1 component beta subunit